MEVQEEVVVDEAVAIQARRTKPSRRRQMQTEMTLMRLRLVLDRLQLTREEGENVYPEEAVILMAEVLRREDVQVQKATPSLRNMMKTRSKTCKLRVLLLAKQRQLRQVPRLRRSLWNTTQTQTQHRKTFKLRSFKSKRLPLLQLLPYHSLHHLPSQHPGCLVSP